MALVHLCLWHQVSGEEEIQLRDQRKYITVKSECQKLEGLHFIIQILIFLQSRHWYREGRLRSLVIVEDWKPYH